MKRAPAAAIHDETPILDLRKHRHGEQIRGAIHYDPEALLKADPLVLPLPKERTIAIYSDDERITEAVGKKLLASGYEDVEEIDGGITAWKASGRPTEPETQDQPVPSVDSAGLRDI
jgi:rhodanese-related sulfurtransferase